MVRNEVCVASGPMEQGVTHVRTIDYNKHEDRVWLSKHSMWCLNNGHFVLSVAREADVDGAFLTWCLNEMAANAEQGVDD